MTGKEKAPIAGTAKQGSYEADLRVKLITESLRKILQDLDSDLYQCTVCISAVAAGKNLTPEHQAMMYKLAKKVHNLARLQRG